LPVNNVVIFVVTGLSIVGLWTIVSYVFRTVRNVREIAVNLNATLREAVALMREYRGDFAVLRNIQAATGPNFGGHDTADEPMPEPARANRVPFPAPAFERFTTKPEEPDAPLEDVEFSGSEQDLMDRDKIDHLRAMGLEVEEPETGPAGREVNAE
jgi:hypothetical protein